LLANLHLNEQDVVIGGGQDLEGLAVDEQLEDKEQEEGDDELTHWGFHYEPLVTIGGSVYNRERYIRQGFLIYHRQDHKNFAGLCGTER
jgi:hypothetical protein